MLVRIAVISSHNNGNYDNNKKNSRRPHRAIDHRAIGAANN